MSLSDVGESMITVTERDKKYLNLRGHYIYKEELKSLPGATFDFSSKVWFIPKSSLPYLEEVFENRLYYKTPIWKIKGEPAPPKEEKTLYYGPKKLPKLMLELYDYQKTGVQFMIDRILKHGFTLNADAVGMGKCLGKGTEVLMYDGTIRKVEDIQKGDLLMGDDNTPRKVLSLARGQEAMYKVTLENGDSFSCNESHILSLVAEHDVKGGYKQGELIDISIKDLLNESQNDVLKAYKTTVNTFDRKCGSIIVPPYIYGLFLGSEDRNNVHTGFGNNAALESICNKVEKSFQGGKHILPEYKYGDVETRLEVIAGLLDSDEQNGCLKIETKHEAFQNDILFICRSLGLSVSHKSKITDDDASHYIYISGNTERIPVRKTLKNKTSDKQKINPLWYDFEIEPLGKGDYYGFTIDGNHRFLLGDFTVTHNTAQSIATIKWFMDNRNIKKILVICKKSIKHQWAREIVKFMGLDDMPTFVTGTLKKSRTKAYNGMMASEKGILVTNYHNYLNDNELISKTGFDFVVIDEVHSLKTHTGKMNNNIADVVQNKPIIFLTGTPIMAQPSDIFGIVQMADKNYFGSYKDFEKRYLDIDYGIYGKQIVGAKNLTELNSLIQEFMIRRTEDDVSIDLPNVVVEEIKCEIDDVQLAINDELQIRIDKITTQKEALLDSGYKPDSPEFEKLLDQEKQYLAAKQFIADDPRCFEELRKARFSQDAIQKIPQNYKMSHKTETTIEYVEDIVASERKVIIFTHFRSSALMLARDIEAKTKKKVLMYTGSESESTRERNIDLFQNSDDYNILIGNEACAEGLNLQCANYVINYEQADTFAQREQRIGRIRRVGSKYKVNHVYDMVTEHSYDEIKISKNKRGADISASLIS